MGRVDGRFKDREDGRQAETETKNPPPPKKRVAGKRVPGEKF